MTNYPPELLLSNHTKARNGNAFRVIPNKRRYTCTSLTRSTPQSVTVKSQETIIPSSSSLTTLVHSIFSVLPHQLHLGSIYYTPLFDQARQSLWHVTIPQHRAVKCISPVWETAARQSSFSRGSSVDGFAHGSSCLQSASSSYSWCCSSSSSAL